MKKRSMISLVILIPLIIVIVVLFIKKYNNNTITIDKSNQISEITDVTIEGDIPATVEKKLLNQLFIKADEKEKPSMIEKGIQKAEGVIVDKIKIGAHVVEGVYEVLDDGSICISYMDGTVRYQYMYTSDNKIAKSASIEIDDIVYYAENRDNKSLKIMNLESKIEVIKTIKYRRIFVGIILVCIIIIAVVIIYRKKLEPWLLYLIPVVSLMIIIGCGIMILTLGFWGI